MKTPKSDPLKKNEKSLTDQQKLSSYHSIISSLPLPVLQRIKFLGEENIPSLFPWFTGTRASFLDALETVEDLNEAIQHGNDYM